MIVIANTISSLRRRQEKKCCEEMIQRCGGNIGNVVFVDAVFEQIQYDTEVVCDQIDIDQRDCVYVMPASSWINKDGSVLHENFLRLKNSNVRVLVLGIGVSMNLGESVMQFVSDLSDDTILSLKIMSEHSEEIGVRGEITGEVLDRLGIHNWRVIGCPSFYEPFRKYGNIKLKDASDRNVLINIQGRKRNSHKMIELGMKAEADILLQVMDELPLTLQGGKILKRHIDVRYPNANFTANQLEEYFWGGAWEDFL